MEDDSGTSGHHGSGSTTQPIDFESLKRVNPYGAEYWSARDLAPLLGYTQWRRFEGAIKRAMTAAEQVGAQLSHATSSLAQVDNARSSATADHGG